MKVLVTGSEGFVGKELVKSLLQSGIEVVGIDRVENTSAIWEHHTLDLTEPLELEINEYDIVVHCAAAKGDWGISNEEFHNDNIAATQNLIDHLKVCSITRIIHFSTVSIYSRNVTTGDEDTLIEPESIYGQTKLDSELLIREFAIDRKIPTVILRPSVIYGRNNYANMYNLTKQLARSLPIQINPEGIIKSHVSVLNVVDVVMKFSDLNRQVDDVEIYNLTESPYLDLSEIIGIICTELAVKPPKINIPHWAASFIFSTLELVARLIRKDLGFTKERLLKYSNSTHYTSEKLWGKIGRQKFKTEDQLRDMVKWFKQKNNDTISIE
ncbi:NAD(P)-dependent oxidoreductase [Akkermansiaceae bacterium]|nr:NAD(P)-dependent oxidoreductase [Akkermansiaceae bacterium]